VLFVKQIRVVNAFQMDIENADSFDRRSLCSLRSQQSLQHYRMLSMHRSLSHDGEAAAAAITTASSLPNNHSSDEIIAKA
jgi:hypothetical protein